MQHYPPRLCEHQNHTRPTRTRYSNYFFSLSQSFFLSVRDPTNATRNPISYPYETTHNPRLDHNFQPAKRYARTSQLSDERARVDEKREKKYIHETSLSIAYKERALSGEVNNTITERSTHVVEAHMSSSEAEKYHC